MVAPPQIPTRLSVDPATGVMTGATRRYEKRLGDLRGLYADAAAFERLLRDRGDRLAYEVYDHRVEERAGDLTFGTSVLQPGDAGQGYDVIERSGGMRLLVVDDGNGGWTTVDNPRWRGAGPTDG